MRPLAQEQNIEILREYAILVTQTAENQACEIAKLKKERDAEVLAAQESLSQELKDQLTRLQKKFFGFGRETLPEKPSRPIGHKGQEVLSLTSRPHVAGSQQTQHQTPSIQEGEIHDIRPSDLIAESLSRGIPMKVGADAWIKIPGLTEDTVEITIVERTYKKVLHKQTKYRLKDEYNTSDKEVIITAPGPVKVKPGMSYSLDFAIAVVTDKYDLHLPLERQRRKIESAGLAVDVKTLYSLCEAVAEHCQAVLPRVKHEIKNDYAAVTIDETPWRILADKTYGQMWVMSNRLGNYYQFEPTRSGAIAEEMLKGYDGAIICDAYGGYNRLAHKPSIRVQHCWAHARREFFERFDDYPTECRQVIELIDQLFAFEREAKSIEELRTLRVMKSRPVVDAIRNFLYETKPRFMPSEGISKAINYCLNHWKGLTHFLGDSTVNISNNEAERALRHVVVGRKNFLGSQTINGADTAAAIYTIIETAKKNSIQPAEYLTYLITERWYKREPMTPKQYADKKLGESTTIKWPPRAEWVIQDSRHA
jgi:transposase